MRLINWYLPGPDNCFVHSKARVATCCDNNFINVFEGILHCAVQSRMYLSTFSLESRYAPFSSCSLTGTIISKEFQLTSTFFDD